MLHQCIFLHQNTPYSAGCSRLEVRCSTVERKVLIVPCTLRSTYAYAPIMGSCTTIAKATASAQLSEDSLVRGFGHLKVYNQRKQDKLQRRAPNTYTWDFPDVIKFRVATHTISEKAILFRHLDYNPDRAQKLISLSMSRHLSTRNMSSKSMHAFLSNLANRQTDKQTRANAFTSSFVGGNKVTQAIKSDTLPAPAAAR